jgi:CHASE3 domain sensor protein
MTKIYKLVTKLIIIIILIQFPIYLRVTQQLEGKLHRTHEQMRETKQTHRNKRQIR